MSGKTEPSELTAGHHEATQTWKARVNIVERLSYDLMFYWMSEIFFMDRNPEFLGEISVLLSMTL